MGSVSSVLLNSLPTYALMCMLLKFEIGSSIFVDDNMMQFKQLTTGVW